MCNNVIELVQAINFYMHTHFMIKLEKEEDRDIQKLKKNKAVSHTLLG